MAQQQKYHIWIRDLLSVEQHAVVALTELKEHMAPWPAWQKRVHQHLNESQENVETVKQLIARSDADVSPVASAEEHFSNCLTGINALLMSKNPQNNFMGSYMLEAYEIGCITHLIAAATENRDTESVKQLKAMVHKDLLMVRWALERISGSDTLTSALNDVFSPASGPRCSKKNRTLQ